LIARIRHRVLTPVLLALAAHLALWLPFPLTGQTLAILLICGVVPGFLTIEWLFGRDEATLDWVDHLLYGAAVGYSWLTTGLLLLSYLPGGLNAVPILLPFDILSVLLVSLILWRARTGFSPTPDQQLRSKMPGWRMGLGLLVLLAVAGALRFWQLGYAEFLTDEARAVLRAAAVVQGQEEALFLHRKGPVEILLPAAIFAVTGQLDEASARLPFALASLLAVVAVLRLGWERFGPLAGWAAAAILALDGFLIGFARFVQYQSIVVLTSALAVLIVDRLVRRPVVLTRSLALVAVLLATGLLSHYDGLVALLPIACLLLGLLILRVIQWQVWLRSVAVAIGLGLGLSALFYLPFLRHRQFDATLAYLAGNRLGGDWPYNNLVELSLRSAVYNDSVFLLAISLLLLVALWWMYRRTTRRMALVGLGLALGFTLFIALGRDGGFAAASVNLVAIPLILGVVVALLPARLGLIERALWLWLALPLLAAIFLIAQPGTHTYVTLIPAALLAGAAAEWVWQSSQHRIGKTPAALLLGLPACLIMALGTLHGYRSFAQTTVEQLHQQQNQTPANASTWASRFTIDRLYGFPLANGWKAIGALYADGTLQGDFETNQRDDLIPDWYTRGQHRCATTATWYFAVDNLETWSQGGGDVEAQVVDQGFAPWGAVTIRGEPRLRIYRRPAEGADPAQHFPLEAYAPRFDATASPHLPLGYPVIEEPMAQPVQANFDNQILLEGYTLTPKEPLQPGDTFRLTVYWRALRPVVESYKVFVQSYYGEGVMVAQHDALPVCDRYPTNRWYGGERVADVHDVPVAADAPPGEYALVVGLYLEENFARLPVLDASGQPVADHMQIGTIQIREPE
jgi:4-amino-4-deoxy-L-arabinose transferase-like glycosyltransferase